MKNEQKDSFFKQHWKIITTVILGVLEVLIIIWAFLQFALFFIVLAGIIALNIDFMKRTIKFNKVGK